MNIFTKKFYDDVDNIIENLNSIAKEQGSPIVDFEGSPDSKFLLKGDTEAGFLGFVSNSEFGLINGTTEVTTDNLLTAMGITVANGEYGQARIGNHLIRRWCNC